MGRRSEMSTSPTDFSIEEESSHDEAVFEVWQEEWSS